MGRNHTYQHEVQKDMEFDFLKYIYLQSGISGNHYFLQFSTFATFMRWNSSSFCYKRISQTLNFGNSSLIDFFRFFLCSSSFSRIYFINLGCRYAEHQCLISATPWPHLTAFSFFSFFSSARTSYWAFDVACPPSRKNFPSPSLSSHPPSFSSFFPSSFLLLLLVLLLHLSRHPWSPWWPPPQLLLLLLLLLSLSFRWAGLLQMIIQISSHFFFFFFFKS